MTTARVEVDPLVPGRQPLLGSHGRHRLGVAGVALAGEGGARGLGLSSLAQVPGLGGAGEGGEVGEAQLVVGQGGLRLLEILNSGVGRHGDSSARVASAVEQVIIAVMGTIREEL